MTPAHFIIMIKWQLPLAAHIATIAKTAMLSPSLVTINKLLVAISFIFSMLFYEAGAGPFAWNCTGKIQESGNNEKLLISGAREPGQDNVMIRSNDGRIKLKLNAVGPLSETVIPDIGRNGEDGIKLQRVYKDSSGRRWIYSNVDAHPSFTLHSSQRVAFSCSS